MVLATEYSRNYPRNLLISLVIIQPPVAKGMLPSFYKEANICPIHKKDDKFLVNIYRPMSILNAGERVLNE